MLFVLLSLLLITYLAHRISRSRGGRGVPVLGNTLDEAISFAVTAATGKKQVVDVDVQIRTREDNEPRHRPPLPPQPRKSRSVRRYSRSHSRRGGDLVKVEQKQTKEGQNGLEIAPPIKEPQIQPAVNSASFDVPEAKEGILPMKKNDQAGATKDIGGEPGKENEMKIGEENKHHPRHHRRFGHRSASRRTKSDRNDRRRKRNEHKQNLGGTALRRVGSHTVLQKVKVPEIGMEHQ